ncbi:hypothetical protein LTR84_003719 [Exophiala bonariae]|uniref:Protein kinase domain-containing protein n=1 Tax=Exophiala bonariae TaxID=1690606 RepID=A0AAV9N693_9EURO|nr:hypothetical protein LTR84_003719 [Exophiala bonariae]
MADLCIKYGKKLMARYRAYKTAEQGILELILRVEHHWLRTESQVEFLRSIWSVLADSLQVHQNNILQVLYLKLQEATMTMDQMIGTRSEEPSMQDVLSKSGPFRKVKFALKLKDCLQKTLEDLSTWQEMLDPSWFLMIRVPSTVIDQQLSSPTLGSQSSLSTIRSIREELRTTDSNKEGSIFIGADILSTTRLHIPFSFSQICHDTGSSDSVIVDPVLCDALTDTKAMTRDIRNLARVLSKIDPLVFGLLSCRGVIRCLNANNDLSRFEFVFKIPPTLHNPTSLRAILAQGRDNHALNDRLDLAKQLASSVLFIHNAQFVHKNIRPETVLVLESDSSGVGVPFLVGFEKFRPIDRHTHRAGDSRWERNLYRHPKRQGLILEEDFTMQHDVYSLGVCLLEIGLWISFVLWQATADEPSPNPILGFDDLLKLKDERKKAFEIKNILVAMAKERLPHKMGKRYTEIVVACLTCLDKGVTTLGEESDFEDEDGILVAVRYIEKVSTVLRLLVSVITGVANGM